MEEAAATHILMMQSDPERWAAHSGHLSQAGFRVTEAADATAVLGCAADRPNLILLDLESSGLALCGRLKADPVTATIPILGLINPTRPAPERARSLDAGADALLPHAADPAELLATVRALLRQAGCGPAMLRQLAGDLDEVVWLMDYPQQRILYVNRAYEKVWGRPIAGLYRDASDWLHAIHPEDRPLVGAALRNRASPSPFDQEYRLVGPDGTVRWIWNRAFPVRDAVGQTRLLIGFAEDVTRRKQLEEQYRQAQKMELVGQLAGGITHDFNNLLTIIQGYGEILLGDVPAGHPAREYVEHIQYAVQRATSLTQQLLAFSRQKEVPPAPLDLNGLVAATTKLLRHMLGPTIRVETQLNAALPAVLGVSSQLEQILINLLSNARDAMPRGGTLTLGTAAVEVGTDRADLKPGRYAVLTVTDTGCGMDAATRARIFEPFYTTKTRGHRTGLGLFMVSTLLHQVGGAITVDSTPGLGSTFRLFLPCGADPMPSTVVPVQAEAGAGTETVLVVQPDLEMRTLVGHLLEMKGYHVLRARHSDEALRLCRQHTGPVHLLLAEGGAAGLELAARLRARCGGLKVLYLTENVEESSPAMQRLNKPFSPGVLARRVREVLDQPPGSV